MKVKNTLIAVFALVFVLGINAAEREYIKLDSKLGHGGQQTWMMMKASDAKGTGAEISSINFNTNTWAEAIVPGTVLTNLVEQKVYPEPYYGQNNYLKNNNNMEKYVCNVCGYEYDPAKGDPDNGIAPGTKFEDLPADWVCPLCSVDKTHFEKQ